MCVHVFALCRRLCNCAGRLPARFMVAAALVRAATSRCFLTILAAVLRRRAHFAFAFAMTASASRWATWIRYCPFASAATKATTASTSAPSTASYDFPATCCSIRNTNRGRLRTTLFLEGLFGTLDLFFRDACTTSLTAHSFISYLALYCRMSSIQLRRFKGSIPWPSHPSISSLAMIEKWSSSSG